MSPRRMPRRGLQAAYSLEQVLLACTPTYRFYQHEALARNPVSLF